MASDGEESSKSGSEEQNLDTEATPAVRKVRIGESFGELCLEEGEKKALVTARCLGYTILAVLPHGSYSRIMATYREQCRRKEIHSFKRFTFFKELTFEQI